MKIKKYSKKERSKEIQFLDEIEKQLKLEHDIREKTLKAIREENRDVIQVLEDIIKLEESAYEKRYKKHFEEMELLLDFEVKVKEFFLLFLKFMRKRNVHI